jgi:hypothetical protein
MAVHLCCRSAEVLLCRSEDDILNVATNTIVMIVLLEYGGTLVAEDSVSLSFSEMTCEKIHCLACQRREGKRVMDQASLMQAIHRRLEGLGGKAEKKD